MEPQSRRWFVRTAALTGLAALAGCSADGGDGGGDGGEGNGDTTAGSGDGWEQTDTVEMTDDLAFAPKRIEVEAGTTVTWENVGSLGHSVTAYGDEIPDGAAYFASGGFDSQSAAADAYPDEGNIPGGESYEYTFETTGTYEYYCIPHEMSGMVGSIKVV